MKKNFIPRYRYYTNGKDTVVAVSTYAGETVRGVAKCAPEDEFDLAKGKKLAAARCAKKVAKKRVHALTDELNWAEYILDMAQKRVDFLKGKKVEALAIHKQVEIDYDNILKEF